MFEKQLSIVKTSKWYTPFNMLLVLTAFGLFLRLFNIGFNSIWLDEGATYSFSHPSKSFMDIWELTAAGEFNPPLFHWIEHIVLMFGETEFLLRLMPCIFGTLSIPVMYYIGKELCSDRVGLVSAFLLAISGFHIHYSQEARSYTLLMLVVSLFVLFYIRYRKEPTIQYAVLMGIAAAAGYWTHFWSLVFVVPVFGILVISAIKNRKHITNAIIAPMCAFLLTLPLTGVIFFLFTRKTGIPLHWGLKDIDLITNYFGLIGYNSLVTSLIFVFLIGMGFLILYKIIKNLSIELGAVCLFVLMMSVIASHVIPMMPRYMITLLPVFYTVAALSLVSMYVNYRKFFWVFLIIILVFSGISLHTYYTTYTREDWKGYSEKLYSATTTGDVIVVLPNYIRLPLDFYYDSAIDGTVEHGVYNSVGELINVTDPSKRTFYIFTWDIAAVDPDLTTVNWLKQNSREIGTHYGITTYVREPV